MFGNRVCKECQKLSERIIALESRISKLETSEIDVLAQLKQIRDKVLRRFRRDEDEQTETHISANPFMPTNGKLR